MLWNVLYCQVLVLALAWTFIYCTRVELNWGVFAHSVLQSVYPVETFLLLVQVLFSFAGMHYSGILQWFPVLPCKGWSRARSRHQSDWGHGSGRQELLQDPLHLTQYLVSDICQNQFEVVSGLLLKEQQWLVSSALCLCCDPAVVEQEQLQTQRWPLRSSPPTWSCTPSLLAGCHVWPLLTECWNKCSSGTLHAGSSHDEFVKLRFVVALMQKYLEIHVPFIPLSRYQGYIGAALVLGGVDCNGPHLYSIYPHGSTDKLPYVTMGQCYTTATL